MTNLRPLSRLGLAFAAVVIAAVAQYLHVYRQADQAAIVLFIVAVLLWLAALVAVPVAIGTRLELGSPVEERKRVLSRAFAISAFVLALLTFLFSSGNEFTPDNVLAWFLSVAAFLYSFWLPEKTWEEWRTWLCQKVDSGRKMLNEGLRISPHVIVLGCVMLLAVFFYYHDLDLTPAEMDSDHAEKLLDVNDIVNNGLTPIFFERNTGREPMQFYLTAAFINLTDHPIDHMALKLITALAGVLVIPTTFLFTRELFDEDVALLAALFIAISKWPLTIARMGLRFPFTPVFVAPTMYFLFRAIKYGRRNDFLMAGLFLGLGWLGYNAFRLVPVLVVAVLILSWLMRRMSLTQTVNYAKNSGLMFSLAVFVAMPVVRYMTEKPDLFWYRAATRLVGEGQSLSFNIAEVFARNMVNAARMFNWTSDSAWPNSLPGDPALDYISGGLFLLGVVYMLYRLIWHREQVHLFVLTGIAIMLLPSALSLAFPNENPSVVRAGGAIPFVFVVVALPLAWLMRAINSLVNTPRNARYAIVATLVLLFALIGRSNYLRYFRDFDANYRQASWNSSEVAEVIRSFADSVGDVQHAWIMLYPHWVDTRNVAINMHQIGWDQTLPNAQAAQGQVEDLANKLYILNPNDQTNLAGLTDLYPDAQQRIFHSKTPGHDFIILYVPGSEGPGEFLGPK